MESKAVKKKKKGVCQGHLVRGVVRIKSKGRERGGGLQRKISG